MSASTKQKAMIERGLQLGMTLAQINRDPDYIAAGREHAKSINDAKMNYSAEQWLEGNSGPFRTAKERENAMAVRVTNDQGKSVLLYDVSPQFRLAVQTKMEQSTNEVCGVYTPPAPPTLLEQAQTRLYHAKRQELFDKANSKDPVVSAQAQHDILILATDPSFAEVRDKMECTERETRPYQTWLRENGPVRVETMTTQAEADAANEANARNPHEPEPESTKI
jgi:hypothetical protein